MYNNIIFVGGVHGVGKGTLCRTISDQTDFIHLSASEVLKWKEINIQQTNKVVDDINDTQMRLINNLQKMIDPSKRYLLDGHLCLLTGGNAISRVPLETFQQINPIGIVIVIEDSQIICDRLNKRDYQEYNPHLLDKLQEEEIAYSKEIATSLGVDLKIIYSNQIDEFQTFLDK